MNNNPDASFNMDDLHYMFIESSYFWFCLKGYILGFLILFIVDRYFADKFYINYADLDEVLLLYDEKRKKEFIRKQRRMHIKLILVFIPWIVFYLRVYLFGTALFVYLGFFYFFFVIYLYYWLSYQWNKNKWFKKW